MTKQIPALNLPNSYDLLANEQVDLLMESLASQEKFEPLDLSFFKIIHSKSPYMLIHYIDYYDKKSVKNIFRQAKENNESELVASMLEITPELEANFAEEDHKPSANINR